MGGRALGLAKRAGLISLSNDEYKGKYQDEYKQKVLPDIHEVVPVFLIDFLQEFH